MVAEQLELLAAREAVTLGEDLLVNLATDGGRALFADARSSTLDLAGRVSNLFRDELYSHEQSHLTSNLTASVFKHESAAAPAYEALATARPTAFPTPYKVLTEGGASPGADAVNWSLPELETSGKWKPGNWLHINSTPENCYAVHGIPNIQTRRALHVSNVPGEWAMGGRNMRVFEAELSPPDQALWETTARKGTLWDGFSIPVSLRDFPAHEVRLTRELFGEELRNLISAKR